MADEQVREAVADLQIPQQRDNLLLHRAIQCRGWFVQENQVRLQHQRSCDGNALALTAGELMGIAMTRVRIQTDFAQYP
nr:hypothetical protein [Tanacetum cinerariifolium]